MTDYYTVLGVKRGCSDDNIKKAYHKLAMKWHPDKHMQNTEVNKKKAEEKFKEINKAYEILGNPEKKEHYDQTGDDDFAGTTGYQYSGANDAFSNFFSTFGTDSFGFGIPGGFNGKNVHVNFNTGHKPSFFEEKDDGPKKDEPVNIDLNITLDELYNGCTKRMKISRKVYTSRPVKSETEILTVEVKPGWKEGTKITFDNKGDIRSGREPADVIFTIKQKPHDVYERDENDLIMTLDITVKDVTYGFSKEIIALDGTPLNVSLSKKSIPSSNYVYKMSGKGMPIRKDGKIVRYGDLLIKFNINFK
jgi:DnaJ family protein B protein 4